MKAIALLLVLFQAQKPNMLTVDQVLAWRTYYGLPLDKDVSEALKVLGEPDIKNKFTRPVEPFFPDRISHGVRGTGLLSVARPAIPFCV
jgi:hypothetical protein